MSDAPVQRNDDAERRHVGKPRPDVEAPVDDVSAQSAQNAHREMQDANTRGTAAALDSIDQGNPPVIVDGGRERRAPGGKDRGEPMEEPPRTVPHTVKKGETLWSISRDNQSDNANQAKPGEVHRALEAILQANPGLNPNRPLREGQTINIPEDIRTGVRQFGQERAGRPTGLVIDFFSAPATGPGGVVDGSHGDFLSKGFEAMGFNVLRANVAAGAELGKGRSDWTNTMERAANYIEANPDKFPPGSFVNTSFGNKTEGKGTGDLTYKDLSKMVKLTVTPGSIGDQRDEILRRLERVAAGQNPETGQPDATISRHDRKVADAAVRTNKQIERIQAAGVEVIHSAGNDGPTRVDINFLRATNLRADGPDGKPLGFSGVGSHTEHGSGIYKFHLIDKNTVATYVNGHAITFPVVKGMPFDRRDHRVDPSKLGDKPNGNPFPVVRRGHTERFDINAFNRGYEQRVYNVGPAVDFAPGTSYSPFSYVARTRNVQRPPEP